MRILRTSLLALALTLPGSAVLAQRAPGWIGIGFEVKSAQQGAGDAAAAVVTEVRDGSPAAGAGIVVGDRLLTINDVSTAQDFEQLAERLALRVGDRVQIRLERNGRRLDLSLRAAERPVDLEAWTINADRTVDSMTETMFRAMDSLRVHILATTRGAFAPLPPDAPRRRFTVAPPAGPEPVDAPFEFFVFRGEQHDSLRLEMDQLNRRIDGLREQESRLAERRRGRSVSRSEVREVEAQLAELRADIEDVVLQSAELRAAMAEAARVTAGLEYPWPAPPDAPNADAPEPPATFRPLTPYLLGSNRVAGAEVVDLRPGLAEYFRVETGVLVVDVAPGTPAAMAGIQPGDVIVNLDRVAIRSVDEFRTGISRAGATLPVTLVRQGSRIQVLLRSR